MMKRPPPPMEGNVLAPAACVSCRRIPVSRSSRNICEPVDPVPRRSAVDCQTTSRPSWLMVGFVLSPTPLVSRIGGLNGGFVLISYSQICCEPFELPSMGAFELKTIMLLRRLNEGLAVTKSPPTVPGICWTSLHGGVDWKSHTW